MSLRVCLLSGYFNRYDLDSKSQGGAEYQNYLLKNELERTGYEVFFISIGDKLERYIDDKTIVYYLAKKKFTRRFGDNFFLYLPQVYKLLKIIDPDYIYLRGGISWIGVGAYYARKYKKKFIWAVASDEDVLPLNQLNPINFLFNSIDRLVANYGKRRSQIIVTQTELQKKLLWNNFKLKTNEIVRNFHPEPVETILKSEDKLKIIWVANFSLNKQPGLFIEIAKEFLSCSDIEFIMIGRPFKERDQKKMNKQIKGLNNLRYLGSLRQEEINLHIARSHILVNTSIFEGFPNVFVQAMLRKTIVISLNSNPDLVLTKYNCGYCAQGSLPNLIAFINTIYKDRRRLKTMSINAYNYARENHLASNQIGKLVKFFSCVSV